jgi:hypothetical protein
MRGWPRNHRHLPTECARATSLDDRRVVVDNELLGDASESLKAPDTAFEEIGRPLVEADTTACAEHCGSVETKP